MKHKFIEIENAHAGYYDDKRVVVYIRYDSAYLWICLGSSFFIFIKRNIIIFFKNARYYNIPDAFEQRATTEMITNKKQLIKKRDLQEKIGLIITGIRVLYYIKITEASACTLYYIIRLYIYIIYGSGIWKSHEVRYMLLCRVKSFL